MELAQKHQTHILIHHFSPSNPPLNKLNTLSWLEDNHNTQQRHEAQLMTRDANFDRYARHIFSSHSKRV